MLWQHRRRTKIAAWSSPRVAGKAGQGDGTPQGMCLRRSTVNYFQILFLLIIIIFEIEKMEALQSFPLYTGDDQEDNDCRRFVLPVDCSSHWTRLSSFTTRLKSLASLGRGKGKDYPGRRQDRAAAICAIRERRLGDVQLS
jgi:hypothetical protein